MLRELQVLMTQREHLQEVYNEPANSNVGGTRAQHAFGYSAHLHYKVILLAAAADDCVALSV